MKSLFSRTTSTIRSLNWYGPAAWVACGLFAYAHVGAVNELPYTVSNYYWLGPLAILLPGVISMTLLPGGWRRWYRWAAILGLSVTTVSDAVLIVLTIAEAWSLHRMWIIERTVPVKRLLTGHRTAAGGSRAGKTKRPRNPVAA